MRDKYHTPRKLTQREKYAAALSIHLVGLYVLELRPRQTFAKDYNGKFRPMHSVSVSVFRDELAPNDRVLIMAFEKRKKLPFRAMLFSRQATAQLTQAIATRFGCGAWFRMRPGGPGPPWPPCWGGGRGRDIRQSRTKLSTLSLGETCDSRYVYPVNQ